MNRLLPAHVHTLGGMFDFAGGRYPGGEVGDLFSESPLAIGQLAEDGRTVARNLLRRGVGPGTSVAVLLSSGVDMMRALSGIATAGAATIPLPMPVMPGRALVTRLGHVIEDSGVRHAIVDDLVAERLAKLLPDLTTLPLSSLLHGESSGTFPPVQADDLAVIQYTSGSTSRPRGVALTHANVLAGVRALHYGTDVRSDDLLCHWLPLSHDMGLFSTLAAVGAGIDVRTSSPLAFIKHPADWLRRFCEVRATILAGPDFSYRALLEAIPADEVADYDLSAVRVLLDGAEPIDPDVITAVEERFAPSGLVPHAMTPCYGLAEATLAVTIAPPAAPTTVDWVDRDALNSARRARSAAPGAPDTRGVVNCGAPVPGVEVRIVEDGRALPERFVGDIEIRGAPVMGGYHRESTPHVRPDGWCPTGDLGYLVGPCLHVTGRSKEMLIVGGRNHYPQDVEEAVRQVDGIYRGRAVAVVLPADPTADWPERIGVLAEVTAPETAQPAIASAIRQTAAEVLDGAAVDVVLVRRGALLRTTSGKFQRLLMRRQLVSGTLDGILAPAAGR